MKTFLSIIFACFLLSFTVTESKDVDKKHYSRTYTKEDARRFILSKVTGVTYYVDATNGNDASAGTSAGTAWKTLSKVNAFNFAAGDAVLFKCGETFYGDIKVHDASMTYSSYGTGADPVITGLQTIASYSGNNNGVYEASITADSTLNLVLINGALAQKAIGANPDSANGGWKKYTAIVKVWNDTLTNILGEDSVVTRRWTCKDSIRGIPSVPVGYRFIHKQNDWSIFFNKVTKQVGDTTLFDFVHKLNIGGNTGRDINKNGWGWKPYDQLACIDRTGEFHYSDKFYIKRTTETVQYSAVDTLFDNSTYDNTTISGIAFVGGNQFGIWGTHADNITISDCSFQYMGAEGVAFYRLSNALITNNTFSDIHATGLYVQSVSSPYNNITVTHNIVTRVGKMEGMGSWGMYGDYSGMNITAFTGLTCMYNYVDDIGDCAIKWNGSNVEIAYNWLSRFCIILQDHGGLYTYWDMTNNGNNEYFRNRSIHHNFISYAYGHNEGTGTSYYVANCIYMDGINGYTDIYENYCWGFTRTGINLNMDSNITVRNNIIVPGDSFTVARCVAVRQFGPAVKNVLVSNNICIIDGVNQTVLAYSANPVIGSGTYDSNYVQRYDLPVWFKENAPAAKYTQAQWLSLTGYGSNDRLLPYTGPTQRRLVTNWSNSPIAAPSGYVDVNGNVVSSVGAYRAVYLIKSNTIINPPNPGDPVKLGVRVQ
ncbi:MAG: right-handed parallel beta-helix repeat-containing protein [Acinetobacter sp.]|uniref:right-handed parallel beta-helix repeat-containing protein n=1 Tax=Acinetobacter sp. TaxID=472 RepID=UPI000F98D8C6|nr:right-handed parallel beta-helix repeat-containing protein [Acinetobacter sp.]RUP39772.1 MAG: right-handed parallel beta-helix repeat-containing protein [Acinetobacter sp.]